ALDHAWDWDGHEADVRYGVFRAIEAIEAAAAEIGQILETTGGARRSTAALRVAPATTARWDVHSRLIGLDDAKLDTVAREGEWTLRETLGHIVGGQRGYAVFTAWYWDRNAVDRPTDDERAAVQAESGLPEESDEAAGTVPEIRARLDDALDRAGAHFAGLSDADLARPGYWSGILVNVDFRVGRWSSHLMEHLIQLDKTLAWMGHQPTEIERTMGELYRAWGRLEAQIFPIAPAALAKAGPSGRSVEDVLNRLGEELVRVARSTRAAAEA
ncbi:MAG TPA: DinB family protein, partial [Candidatus Limnocylindrales bacterium]